MNDPDLSEVNVQRRQDPGQLVKQVYMRSQQADRDHWQREYRHNQVESMPLAKAKLCADIECGTVHNGNQCPTCASEQWMWLSKVLNRRVGK